VDYSARRRRICRLCRAGEVGTLHFIGPPVPLARKGKSMTISSTRGAPSDDVHRASIMTVVAGIFRSRPDAPSRLSRWVVVIYIVAALAAPLLMYAGPEVMSPAAPMIADKALDGEFSVRLHAIRHADAAAATSRNAATATVTHR
jgi:hypothetical protein